MVISIDAARKRLFTLIKEVNDDQEAVEIRTKIGAAFLVPEAQWRALEETQHLTRSPTNARRLLDSTAAVEQGTYAEHQLLSAADGTTPPAPRTSREQ